MLPCLTEFCFIDDLFLKARSIWYSGGGGGAWDILEKKFFALILTKKNKLAQWHSEKK